MQEDTAYTGTVAKISGGIGAVSYAITAGTLPAGLSLYSSTGVISGTPTGNGLYDFTVTATDSATPAAVTKTQQFTGTVITKSSLSTSLESATANATTGKLIVKFVDAMPALTAFSFEFSITEVNVDVVAPTIHPSITWSDDKKTATLTFQPNKLIPGKSVFIKVGNSPLINEAGQPILDVNGAATGQYSFLGWSSIITE